MEPTTIISATIYTDGSCHTAQRLGAWVAIILLDGNKQVLSGAVPDTTHNRMELTAVIKALEYCRQPDSGITHLTLCSDSQYVIGLTGRETRLSSEGFTTKGGKPLPNADLVTELLALSRFFTIEWIKIAAHQRQTENINYNREADMLARKLVRANVHSDASPQDHHRP